MGARGYHWEPDGLIGSTERRSIWIGADGGVKQPHDARAAGRGRQVVGNGSDDPQPDVSRQAVRRHVTESGLARKLALAHSR